MSRFRLCVTDPVWLRRGNAAIVVSAVNKGIARHDLLAIEIVDDFSKLVELAHHTVRIADHRMTAKIFYRVLTRPGEKLRAHSMPMLDDLHLWNPGKNDKAFAENGGAMIVIAMNVLTGAIRCAGSVCSMSDKFSIHDRVAERKLELSVSGHSLVISNAQVPVHMQFSCSDSPHKEDPIVLKDSGVAYVPIVDVLLRSTLCDKFMTRYN